MRNRILSITRNVIPYVKELYPLTGSVHGCLIMQQLDYWFTGHPEGFYKFLEPTEHASYKSGDSWVEELGMSRHEFRSGFDHFGIRYKSKSEYESVKKAGKDPFNGKFYLSYVDRKKNLTYYRRNHQLLDLALDSLISDGCTPLPKMHQNSAAMYNISTHGNDGALATNCYSNGISVDRNPALQESKSGFTANPHSDLQEIQKPISRNPNSELYKAGNRSTPVSEITSETTTTTTTATGLSTEAVDNLNETSFHLRSGCGAFDPEKNKSVESTFEWPLCSTEERAALGEMLKALHPEQQQIFLDEIEGARSAGTIRVGLIPFAGGLMRAMLAGTFTVGHAPTVASKRKARIANNANVTQMKTCMPEMNADDIYRGQLILARAKKVAGNG